MTASQNLPLPPGWTGASWAAIETGSRTPLWALIDGVVFRDASQILPFSGLPHSCLTATTDPEKRALSPWLVRLDPGTDLARRIAQQPADAAWGVLFNSDAEMTALRQHLRKFTMIWTPANDQAPVYFRFYDPRVLVDLFAILPAAKLAALSRPVSRWIVPDGPGIDLTHRLAADADPEALLRPAAGPATRYLSMVPPKSAASDGGPSQFAITDAEAARFAERQSDRSITYLARDLAARYPHQAAALVLAAVRQAVGLAAAHGMRSTRQVSTLAACLIEFGPEFPNHYPEAEAILTDSDPTPWQRRQALSAWMSRGRILRRARGY